jgi:hypothetical protein
LRDHPLSLPGDADAISRYDRRNDLES